MLGIGVFHARFGGGTNYQSFIAAQKQKQIQRRKILLLPPKSPKNALFAANAK
jgi:hypothetical protein